MIDITNKTAPALDRSNLGTLNRTVRPAYDRSSISQINGTQQNVSRAMQRTQPQQSQPPQRQPQSARPQPVQSRPQPAPQPVATVVPDMVIPELQNLLHKGQKAPLSPGNSNIRRLKVCFGWNVTDGRCDIDASAFLTGTGGKVPGDEWFVFYGQEQSPDGSVRFAIDQSHRDREIISVDLTKLDSRIQKIIFVMTINEAYEKNLNFSMIKDAYIRIIDAENNRILLSYRMEELYANVTSMTIGELYLHNGQWKFNPVGNGVKQDLAGQCAIYGVAIS